MLNSENNLRGLHEFFTSKPRRLITPSPCHSHQGRGIRGFTLIELIMTIVVVSIIAIPLTLFLGQHVVSVVQSEDYTMTVDLARHEMERVKNLAYANVVSASFSNYQGYNYDVTRTVSFTQGTALTPESLKFVRVDVRKSGSATILFSLVTYLARNVIYGV